MNIQSAFPSKFLKAADLPDGRKVNVTIDHVTVENVIGGSDPDDEKPILYFLGKSKGLVLNKTNSNTISAAYGYETDDWHGKSILIYSTETEFGGKRVPCIRISIDKSRMNQPAAPANGPAQQPARQQRSPVQEQQARAAATVAPSEAPFGDEQQFAMDDIPF